MERVELSQRCEDLSSMGDACEEGYCTDDDDQGDDYYDNDEDGFENEDGCCIGDTYRKECIAEELNDTIQTEISGGESDDERGEPKQKYSCGNGKRKVRYNGGVQRSGHGDAHMLTHLHLQLEGNGSEDDYDEREE